ncbi:MULTISPECIES: hypothetical protein [unclassified Campylobacter]|uniref:hypothetical protein n=1 Tax=unclassified Campylobacter TaxID=2593542 RepID=UPI0022E9A815|nr:MULTISPECIES: hypothetical protein [unclassified Campylobacter]MDA3055620.1 hypothetical protein [Campylobacter sp. CN_NA1]MDA3064690.1 hypothetical protein [Campylobacter sp. CN_NE4]MDA3068486.1 hypothetical protein [Campylobacter sp. CN_NE3]MDA3082201.1 hypothetical protein [Campylobacter sp. CN_EL2]MDA3083836.1 hypothetical protein [Campylobacter sp. CN_NE1]
MKEIVVQFTGKSLAKTYTINLEDEFAKIFEKDWERLSKGEKFLDAGELLEAYIQKSYENFTLIKEIEEFEKETQKSCGKEEI